jgi:hypothetical protein
MLARRVLLRFGFRPQPATQQISARNKLWQLGLNYSNSYEYSPLASRVHYIRAPLYGKIRNNVLLQLAAELRVWLNLNLNSR